VKNKIKTGKEGNKTGDGGEYISPLRSEASMSDVEIASLGAVIKKIEHACK